MDEEIKFISQEEVTKQIKERLNNPNRNIYSRDNPIFLESQNRNVESYIWDCLFHLEFAELATKANFTQLMQHSDSEILHILGGLQHTKSSLTQVAFNFLLQSAANADKVGKGIMYLHQARLGNDTTRAYAVLAKNFSNADDLGLAIYHLSLASPRLDTLENLLLLSQNAVKAKGIGGALYELSCAKPRLDTQANFEKLIQNPNHLETVSMNFHSLRFSELRIDTQENFELLLNNPMEGGDLVEILVNFGATFLDTPQNVNLLAQHVKYSRQISGIVQQLYINNPKLLNQENINLLFQYPKAIDTIDKQMFITPVLDQTIFEGIVNKACEPYVREQNLTDALGLVHLGLFGRANPSAPPAPLSDIISKYLHEGTDLTPAITVV